LVSGNGDVGQIIGGNQIENGIDGLDQDSLSSFLPGSVGKNMNFDTKAIL